MKILVKIEELFNKLFYKFTALLVTLYRTLTPKKIQDKIINAENKFTHTKNKGLQKVQTQATLAAEKMKKATGELSKINFQEKATLKASAIKEQAVHIKSLGLKKNLSLISESIKKKARSSLNWMTQPHIKVYTGLSATLGVLGFLMYGQVQVFLKESGIRSPASLPFEPEAIRPNYYKMDEKQYMVYNVILPIFIESKRSMTSVKLDMTIRTSNRQAILYLKKNEAEIRDYMHTKLEPMVPTFPIEKEGRAIIKQKLADELNTLFKREGVEGKVEEIYLKEILGG